MMDQSRQASPDWDGVDVVVFDMDGTLYQLDGENNGFRGSSLHRSVAENTLRFIARRECCSSLEAQAVAHACVASGQPASAFFSKRYGIARSEFLDVVWDIDPRALIADYEVARPVLLHLKRLNKRLVLVTAAPRVWQRRVFEHLGTHGIFDRVHTGDEMSSKDVVFREIAGQYEAARILSIGDQVETDIEPAAALGMQVFHVKAPRDLQRLFSR